MVGGRNPADGRALTLWLLTAEPNDASAIREAVTSSSIRPPGAFLATVDGSSPIASGDLLLLRTRGTMEVFAPAGPREDEASVLGRLSEAFIDGSPIQATTPSVLEMTFVRLSDRAPLGRSTGINDTLTWALDCFQAPEDRRNVYLAERVAGDVLENMPPDAASFTRALFSRLRADVLLELSSTALENDSVDWSEIAGLYKTAAREFRDGAFTQHATECSRRLRAVTARLDRDGLGQQSFLPGLEPAEVPAPPRGALRFRTYRCLGIPFASTRRLGTPVQDIRRQSGYRWIGTLPISDKLLLDCMGRSRSARLQSAVSIRPLENADASHAVRVVVEDEHIILLGLAGQGLASRGSDRVVIVFSCAGCDVTPSRSVMEIGQVGEFLVRPRWPGQHKIQVSLVTSRGQADELYIDVGA